MDDERTGQEQPPELVVDPLDSFLDDYLGLRGSFVLVAEVYDHDGRAHLRVLRDQIGRPWNHVGMLEAAADRVRDSLYGGADEDDDD